jgi:methylmalonyl-CoA mutase N-terminal domain/subunit
MSTQQRPAVPTTHAEWLEAYGATPERDAEFVSLSGEPVKPLYTADDVQAVGPDGEQRIGVPGGYPFTRGVYPSMYRGRLWTMRQFAGFGTAEETNDRFHYLLEHGQTGLSTAFDMPSLMGHDSDHAMSLGEVGREGVAVDTAVDMADLFAGIDLGEVSVSMTINAPAAIMLAFYVVAAEEQGVAPERLGGTIQADILKEYIAQKEWCFPVDPAMRLMGDMVQWCTETMPRWHPVSISGYHIREAGSTAQQELAFTLKDGLTYVQQAVDRGLDVDDFAPRLSFFFNAQIDFFEEIAKYRAARRIWARELRETFGAKNPKSWLMRTQQIIAHETGVTSTIDPLGGSYYVEALTDQMEAAAYDYFRRIDELGGMVEAVKQNFCQREIADASYELQGRIDHGDRVVVGVNRYTEGDDGHTEILRIDPALERKQIDRVQAVKTRRESAAVEAGLAALKDAAARDGENLMPHLLDVARAHATEGEIIAALQEVFGSYTETPVF